MSVLDDYVRQAVEGQTDVAERMVERMLVTPGDYGVIVYSWFDGNSFRSLGKLTKDVPAMTIAYENTAPPDTP